MSGIFRTESISRRAALKLGAAAVASAGLARPAIASTREVILGINYGLPFLPFMVAEKLDYFNEAARDAGVSDATFSTRRFNVATAVIDAVLSENVQFGTMGSQAMLNAYEKTKGNHKVRALSAYWKGMFSIYSNTDRIKSFTDIQPTDKICVQGPKSAQALYLKRAAAHFYGPDQAARFDNQLVLLPHTEAVMALTKSETIQVYVTMSPFAEIVASDPKVNLIATSREFANPETTNAFVGTLLSYTTENPDIGPIVIAGLNKANAFISDNVDETTDIYLEAEPQKLSLEEMRTIIGNNRNEYATIPNGVMEAASFLAGLGEIGSSLESWKDPFLPPISDGPGS